MAPCAMGNLVPETTGDRVTVKLLCPFASYLLHATQGSLDIVEEREHRTIPDVLPLPVRERVHQQQIHFTANQSIGRAISDLVPGVCRPNLRLGEDRLDVVDLAEQFQPGEVPAIERLAAYSDGVDLMGVLG